MLLKLLSLDASACSDTKKFITEGPQLQDYIVIRSPCCVASPEVMETLIAARASTHHADVARATPVHWASLANNANGLRMLCEARAELMKQNVLGMSVFDMACCNGAVESMAETGFLLRYLI